MEGEMKRFLAPALFLVLAAASAPQVSVITSDGDWSRLPELNQRGYEHLNTKMMIKLHEIAMSRQCQLPGIVGNRLDLNLSFAAQYNRDGSLKTIVIPRYNCPEAEGVIGGALLEMMQGGDYKPTGKNPDGWYRGNFGFAFEG
jgi:hypothetical protein